MSKTGRPRNAEPVKAVFVHVRADLVDTMERERAKHGVSKRLVVECAIALLLAIPGWENLIEERHSEK